MIFPTAYGRPYAVFGFNFRFELLTWARGDRAGDQGGIRMTMRMRVALLALVAATLLAGEARACFSLPDVGMLEDELRGKWIAAPDKLEEAVASLYRAHERFQQWEAGHFIVDVNPVWNAVVRAVYGGYGWCEPPDFEAVVEDAIIKWNEGG